MFGPSGDERPDVLTDAETVVLPVWLHRRPAAEKAPPETAASFLKTISVPAQAGEATVAEPETGELPAAGAEGGSEAEPEAGPEAEHQAEAAPETGANAGPAAEIAEGAARAEDEAETAADSGPTADAEDAANAGPDADAGATSAPAHAAGSDADAGAIAGAEPETGVDANAEAKADAATQAAASRPESETIARFSLADLKAAALKAKTAQADTAQADTPTVTLPTMTALTPTAQASTLPTETAGAKTAQDDDTVPTKTLHASTVPSEAVEAIEAIDALETSTIDGLEARTAEALETVEAIEAIEAKTAEAMEAIEAMTADALEAIDATAAEIATTMTGEPRPDRTEAATSSPGAEVAPTRVIRIDEPPVSITLTTSATETTIAVPQPRSESMVAVSPTPADTATLTAVPQRARSGKPAALPPAGPGPQAEPEAGAAYVAARRRTRVSRVILLAVLCLQAILSLRLHNTAFEDEALYVYSGHMELQHLLHGTALQGQYASYFSGSPVLYPVAAGFLNGLGGLAAARMLSLAEMLSITVLLYSLTRRLFNERIALCAAVLFSVSESAIFLGNFATYDATCLFLLACAAWIAVRTAGFRWPVFLMAAPVAALAVGVKYAGLLFVPTIAALPMLAGWPRRGRRVVLYPPAFVAAVAGLLYGALKLGGKPYMTAISSTTTNRVQGVTPVATLLRESAEWGGLIFLLALIGTAAYAWRIRTDPEELIAPAGGRFRRLCLGVVLSGTALLAPAYQAHLHTDISFQKHIGFGLFFAAPIAGLGLSRLLGDHFRRPHIAVGIWSLALVLGLVQSAHLYQVWPNSKQFVRAFSNYLKPHARYLVEVPEVPIYYLLGHADAQPRQFTSTFYINYRNSKRVLLSGTVGFTAAVDAGYFDVVAYNNEVTGAADAVLAQALSASKDYYLAAEIHITDVFGPGDYFIWVRGHLPKPGGVFAHASSKYQDLGTKTRELAP